MISPTILVLAGGIGSGKTTISRALAERFGWNQVNCGSVIRAKALRVGLPSNDRHVLQDLVLEWVKRDVTEFSKAILEAGCWQAGQSLLVDGVRNRAVVEGLRQLTSPSITAVVYLEACIGTRRGRVRVRNEAEDLSHGEAHAVEIEATTLREIAALIVDAEGSTVRAVDEIAQWLRNAEEKTPV